MAVLVLLAGCRPGAGGDATGAPSSDAAVQQFLFAAKAGDIQAMSAVWGDREMPTRDRVSRQELERRLLIIVCHLKHDESRIGAPETGEGGRVKHRVELTQGERRASPMFTTVRNLKDTRWYVEDLDMNAVQAFCAPASQRRPSDRSEDRASAVGTR